MVDVKIETEKEIQFNFERYVKLILSVIPENHLLLLEKIHFVDQYNKNIGCDKNGYGCYFFERKQGHILVNLSNITKSRIPPYLFDYYSEIAALYLSEILGHEIGHHVEHFWRHGIKNKESFAHKYSETCYFNYFKLRKKLILLTYFLAGINILDFSKDDRMLFKKRRREHLQWYQDNRIKYESIGYP